MTKLILALALLLTPFFSKISMATEPDSVSPQIRTSYECESSINGSFIVGSAPSIAECADLLVPLYPPDSLPTSGAASVKDVSFKEVINFTIFAYYTVCHTANNAGECIGWHVDLTTSVGSALNPTTSFACPSDDFPDYIYGVDSNDDGDLDQCFKDNPALEKCPQGYYKHAASGTQCIPVKCDNAGSQKSIWASASVYNNTTGTYCDGSCAHSVAGSQNNDSYTGNFSIHAVSTGEVCGQGDIDDKWHNEGTGDDCQSVDVGTGTNFISCSSGNVPDSPPDTEPTIDLEPEKFNLEEITPLIPVEETCAAGDASCEIRNLKETLITKGLEQKEIDKILHNKQITADEKSSTKIIDGINDSAGRNAQGLQMLTAAIDGLKGEIGTGGAGSNGDGFGDGDVICDAEDNCEGGIETDIEPTAGLVGYWETEYEDGLQGIMDAKLIDIKNTEFFGFLDQFNPTLGGGSAPSYQMCFNIGSLGNFGCHSFDIDPRTFPAIRIFILVSAGFLCRRILFGG